MGAHTVYVSMAFAVKGIVPPQLQLFTHPQVVPNLFKFLFSDEHKRHFKECW